MTHGSRILHGDLERSRSSPVVVSRQRGCEQANDLIDRMIDAYVDWREERGGVWAAHELWAGAPPPDRRLAFAAYRAALEREEQASRVYADLVGQLCTRSSTRRSDRLRMATETSDG